MIYFNDVFPNELLGVVSVTKTGEGVVGAFRIVNFTIRVDNANKAVEIPLYGGRGGDNCDVSGIITVTAIGY